MTGAEIGFLVGVAINLVILCVVLWWAYRGVKALELMSRATAHMAQHMPSQARPDQPSATRNLLAGGLLLGLLGSQAACELCNHLEGPQHEICEASLQLNCDMNGDGSGDAHGTCDANQLCWVAGQSPGQCV